jgi:hypothetical protein
LAKLNMLTILAIVVTLGTSLFLLYLFFPWLEAKVEYQDDEAFNQRFAGYSESETVIINFTESGIEGEIERGRQAFAACKPAFLNLFYDQGGNTIAIDDDVRNDTCAMAIIHREGGAFTSLDCTVPAEKLAGWDEWTRSPDVSQLMEHCKEINSFDISEIRDDGV